MTKKFSPLEVFSQFAPNSRGDLKIRSDLTINNIINIFPLLTKLSLHQKNNKTKIIKINSIPKNFKDLQKCNELKVLLDNYGSDKSNRHNYHYLYSHILNNKNSISGILEIGLGTNNVDILSNMGIDGKPGASLRAFRDFCPNAEVYGADIDKRILFTEDRISTYYVDQTDTSSLDNLNKIIPNKLDLVIDDGLHSPCSNINTLIFGIDKIKVGGWLVVEDISIQSQHIWMIISNLMSNNYSTYLIQCERSLIYAIERLK